MTIGGWTSVTVEQCCEILDSKRVPVNGEDREKRIGEVPYYGANGLQGYIDDFIFDEPLILIAEDGGTFDEFATRPIAYRINGKSWVNNHAHVLRAKKEFDQDAVFYSLEHKDIQSFIVGGTRSKLNQSALRAISFSLPTAKPEQTKIAEILSTVERAIEQTEALIAKQQRIKTGLMQDLLTRGIDEYGNLRSEQTHQFKDSPLGRIPVEWDIERVKDVARVSYGISDAIDVMNKSGVPTVTLPCVSPNGNLTIEPNKLAYTSRKAVKESDLLQRGDLLFNWRNGSQNHLGKTAYFNDSGKFTHVGFLLKIRTFKSKCDSRFLWYMINDIKEKGYFLTAKIQVNNTFNSSELNAVELKLPRIGEQKMIRERLDALEKAKSDLASALAKLGVIKIALMQDLLTGKKRVTALLKETEGASA